MPFPHLVQIDNLFNFNLLSGWKDCLQERKKSWNTTASAAIHLWSRTKNLQSVSFWTASRIRIRPSGRKCCEALAPLPSRTTIQLMRSPTLASLTINPKPASQRPSLQHHGKNCRRNQGRGPPWKMQLLRWWSPIYRDDKGKKKRRNARKKKMKRKRRRLKNAAIEKEWSCWPV